MVAGVADAGAAGASDQERLSARSLTSVAAANPKAPGLTTPNRLSRELAEVPRAQGSNEVENRQDGVGYYGYDSVRNNPPLLPVVGPGGSLTEAHKTEPDKNTYLILNGQRGPDTRYNYGNHFLFQGHESGTPGYVTRINLDADAAHRVTVLATKDSRGRALPTFDGSTWNPFTRQLLMTAELGCNGGVWAGSAEYRGAPFAEIAAMGKGGYEGVQTASDGSVWLVEDVGGATPAGTNGRLPNSYVYRFVPQRRADLRTGTLQALQVLRPSGAPMNTGTDLLSQDIKDLHRLGTSYATRWVTVHRTTSANLDETFCATTAAKAAGATPLKRPENGVFRPGSRFREFFFTETGDTNANSVANADAGGFGGVFRLTQTSASASTGRLSLVAAGDLAHTGLDNLSFASRDNLLVVEDAGDLLHTQRNALDSGFVYDVRRAVTRQAPVRFLAEGRDPSATIDSALTDASTPGFTNDGDNEITGIHVSDGDPAVGGLLGAKEPRPFSRGWRVFWTQQHGDNTTWEIIPRDVVSHDGKGESGAD
jgi:hypothetical protein